MHAYQLSKSVGTSCKGCGLAGCGLVQLARGNNKHVYGRYCDPDRSASEKAISPFLTYPPLDVLLPRLVGDRNNKLAFSNLPINRGPCLEKYVV